MTLLRSLTIALLSIAAAHAIRPLLVDSRSTVRRLAWMLLLAPYLTPVLLTGYAYANFSLSLIHHPTINTLFYSALLLWKYTPLAAVILHFTPAPISPEAIHCQQLISETTKLDKWLFLIRAGCLRGASAAFAIVFLFAFAEFEMASLMKINSWTVSLFDAHVGGLELNESLRRMLWPLLSQAVAIAIALAVLRRKPLNPERNICAGAATRSLAWGYLLIAFTAVLAIPAATVLWGTVRGFQLLIENFVLGREIVASLLFATGASSIAGLFTFGFSALAHGNDIPSKISRTILVIAVLIGLLGPLLLSLMILRTVQLPVLISLRDTPAPLVIALALMLLPIAIVMTQVLELTKRSRALHLAALMQKSPVVRELTWRFSTRGKFWTMALLFVCAYWDLTASAILAPIGMTPVTVRLYNMMHYGQIAALSAMTCMTFAAPIAVFSAAIATRRWWAPR